MRIACLYLTEEIVMYSHMTLMALQTVAVL